MNDSPTAFDALHSVWNTILTGVATVTGWAIKRQVDRIDVLERQIAERAPVTEMQRLEAKLEASLTDHRTETRAGFEHINNRLDDVMTAISKPRRR